MRRQPVAAIARPVAALPPYAQFKARVHFRSLHRYTAHPVPAALRPSYGVLLKLPMTVPPPTLMVLVDALLALFEAEAGEGAPELWWGLLVQSLRATVWTPGMQVVQMNVRTDAGVKRMLEVADGSELHRLGLGEEEGGGQGSREE